MGDRAVVRRDVAVGVVAAILLTVALGGCGGGSPFERVTGTPSGDPREDHVVAETARFAGMLGVRVRGVVTDVTYLVPAQAPRYPGERVPAAGWYAHGVAYYYRPVVLTRDAAYLTRLAAHETCHALHRSEEGANACAAGLVGG
jgi:hypothetical protein